MSTASFSLDELRTANKVKQAGTNLISASDGIVLAYRKYIPDAPCAVVLFYHGGGAHSGAGYQFLGDGLQSKFDRLFTCLIFEDMGLREVHAAMRQTQSKFGMTLPLIRFIRAEYPHLPLFIGGHSSAAGPMLNYISQPDHESADGYLFLSPQLGQQAQIDRPALV